MLERPTLDPPPEPERPTSASRTSVALRSSFEQETAAAAGPSAVAPAAKLRLSEAYAENAANAAQPGRGGSVAIVDGDGFELVLPPRKKKQARDATVRAAASAILRAVGV